MKISVKSILLLLVSGIFYFLANISDTLYYGGYMQRGQKYDPSMPITSIIVICIPIILFIISLILDFKKNEK